MPTLDFHPSGRHFLQIPGPSPVPDRILRAISLPTIDHRGPEFGVLGLKILAGLQQVFQTVHPNSGPRWSMVGRLMARKMRSGTGLGPGICKKWRPVGCWSSFMVIKAPGSGWKFCIQNWFVHAEYPVDRKSVV